MKGSSGHVRALVMGAVLLVASLVSAATLSFQTFTSAAFVPVSNVAGSAIAVGALERKTITLESVGTGTYQVQISLDNSASPAAASWQNEGTALTASGSLEISKPCAWLRLNVTGYSSGTPTLRVAGLLRQ